MRLTVYIILYQIIRRSSVSKSICSFSFQSYFAPIPVPDLLVDGVLQKTQVLLDKQQLELIKGLLDKNLGEPIEQFETPNTVIKDPVDPVSV